MLLTLFPIHVQSIPSTENQKSDCAIKKKRYLAHTSTPFNKFVARQIILVMIVFKSH